MKEIFSQKSLFFFLKHFFISFIFKNKNEGKEGNEVSFILKEKNEGNEGRRRPMNKVLFVFTITRTDHFKGLSRGSCWNSDPVYINAWSTVCFSSSDAQDGKLRKQWEGWVRCEGDGTHWKRAGESIHPTLPYLREFLIYFGSGRFYSSLQLPDNGLERSYSRKLLPYFDPGLTLLYSHVQYCTPSTVLI